MLELEGSRGCTKSNHLHQLRVLLPCLVGGRSSPAPQVASIPTCPLLVDRNMNLAREHGCLIDDRSRRLP